ncbi:MAG TPA: TonB-dependent receptor [Telluria sp.]|jgi:outer membrane receptor protein involved in Fe transport
MHHRSTIKLTVLAALLAAIGPAQASGVPTLKEVLVKAGEGAQIGIADSATEGTVGAQQIATRPLLRAAELIETIPGMIVTQHSGDGKANQFFLRGFNLDHGSDFATLVGGVPVNVASHGHGQGYMDLNFVIPELVSTVRYRKGVYAAEDGNFSATGSARIDYQRALAQPFIDLTVGPHNFRRALGAGSAAIGEHTLLGAIESGTNDGPWDQPERLRKVNALLRWSLGSASNGYALTAQAYRSHWIATEHVPERAIDSAEIGRFGALSGDDGGVTHRYSLGAEWARSDAAGSTRANAYLVDYGLNLFSAPSGFINGPEGDQHEQADARVFWGGAVQQTWALKNSELAAGLQLRHDRASTLGLYRTIARVRTGTIRQDRVSETEAGLYGAWHQEWAPWLRTSLAVRHDRINASATATGGVFNGANGGDVSAGQTSPKLSVVLTPAAHTEVFVNWGRGFHSNDVRGATTGVNPADGSPSDKLGLFAQAKGGELGLRVQPRKGWTSSVSLWRMSLASELVFVGDDGVTEARGASRRHGIEWSNYLTPAAGIIIDADLALSRARFREPVEGGGRDVPNAVPRTASVGVSMDQGNAWFGGLRTRYIGAYALEESGSEKSRPVLTTNLKLGYRIEKNWQLAFDVLNLFDRRANDIEYWGGACTRAEQANGVCGDGIDGRLIHPLEPRTLRASVRATF